MIVYRVKSYKKHQRGAVRQFSATGPTESYRDALVAAHTHADSGERKDVSIQRAGELFEPLPLLSNGRIPESAWSTYLLVPAVKAKAA